MNKTSLTLLLLGACVSPAFARLHPSTPAVAGASRTDRQQWDGLVDEYYGAWFALHPSAATAEGLHDHDGQLESFTAEGRAAQIALLKSFLGRFTGVQVHTLAGAQRHDRELVLSAIRAELLDLEEVRSWQRDPGFYPGLASEAVWKLMSRTFASPETRLRSVVARERLIPAMLETGRANLKTPPRIFTEVALEQLPGLVSFFGEDLPGAFKDVADPALLADFKAANAGVVAALNAYQAFLKREVLPASTGNFALGADLFRRKLLLEEMVDIPLDRLLALGQADLHRNQDELKRVAALIDPKASVQQVLALSAQDHPPAGQVLKTFQDQLEGARAFILDHQLMTIPKGPLPIVRETPPFMRALTQASMDTPGPFETAKEAYFHVTLPEAGWSRSKTEAFLGGLNRPMVQNVAVHEAYPGHYVQFLWVNWTPISKIRKLTMSGTNVEGWAHYGEQLMVEEGYAAAPRLRVEQLRDALLRDARYVVAIQLHTGGMTLDQARTFFVREGFQNEVVADMEAKRGAADPMYLEYTLGKLELLKLREDFHKKRGAQFTLKGFHDGFLSHGPIPIRIIRTEMLGTVDPVL